MAMLSWTRVALRPQITWPPRSICSGITPSARHLPDVGVVLAVGDRQALARHGGEADDRALAGLAVDLGQHHVGRGSGERALALDRRQLAGIAQHQDRLAEGEQVARHVVADHRDLVEHDQRGVAHDRLLVEHEARLVDVVEPDLEAAEPRLLEQPDGGIEGRQLAP